MPFRKRVDLRRLFIISGITWWAKWYYAHRNNIAKCYLRRMWEKQLSSMGDNYWNEQDKTWICVGDKQMII